MGLKAAASVSKGRSALAHCAAAGLATGVYVVTEAAAATSASALATSGDVAAQALALLQSAARRTAQLYAELYAHEPILALVLAVSLAIVPLAILGGIARRFAPRSGDVTQTLARRSVRQTVASDALSLEPDSGADKVPAWPSAAWLEIEGGPKAPMVREMLRIGRDPDNDVMIPDRTVHRYHAVIRRTEDAEFVVQDLSSQEGNGVILNGRRTEKARLRDGDRLRLGEAVLIFKAQPI